jgi:hypothetical protein
MSRIVHVLWAPQSGPICGYDDPMFGVEVTGIEIREELPDIVRQDLATEYDNDEPTPVSIVDIDDIDDVKEDE